MQSVAESLFGTILCCNAVRTCNDVSGTVEGEIQTLDHQCGNNNGTTS